MRNAALAAFLLAGALQSAFAQDPARAADLGRQAVELISRGDMKGAVQRAEEALRLDPECGPALGARGYVRSLEGRFLMAIDDLSRASKLDPENLWWPWQLCKCYMSLDRWRAAFDIADEAWPRFKAPALLSLRGHARINLGEVDAGLAEMDEAFRLRPEASTIDRFDGYYFKADWKELVEEGKRFLASNREVGSHALFFQVVGYMELGDHENARRATEESERRFPKYVESFLCRGYLHGDPAARDLYDYPRALAAIRSGTRSRAQQQAIAINAVARAHFRSGRFHEAVDELEAHGRLTSFDTLFLLGAAHFRLGNLREARRVLADAQRLNPYLSRHAQRVPGLAAFRSGFDRDVEADAKSPDRAALGAEREIAGMALAEIETLVRRFQFRRAAQEYRRWLDTTRSPFRRREIESRLAEVDGMATSFERLAEGLNAGRLEDLSIDVQGIKITLTKAVDGEKFEYRFPKGSGKGLWPGLGIGTMIDFLLKASPTPGERFSLGVLAWENGLPERAQELLQAAGADASLAPRLDGFLSRVHGIPIPEGGFVAFKGRYVTPGDKQNLEQGLVRFRNDWVTPADRAKLERGLVKEGDAWITPEEADLMHRGFRKYQDRWVAREEWEVLHSRWDSAFQEQTEHYDIRTNESEAFAKELARLIEKTYAECKELYGGKEPTLPGKERMTLYAFGTYEDYRRHCTETKHEAQLQAAGFASSDSNVVAGWDKTDNRQQFLQTMSHEAAHLYYFRIAPSARPPSWYAEGLATQLEGFQWDGKEYAFDRLSSSRVPFIRQAVDAKKHFPLADLFRGDALALINADPSRALTFYAECWALVYYLCHTSEAKHVESFRRYREAIDAGTDRPPAEFFPDLAQLEKDFLRFAKGL